MDSVDQVVIGAGAIGLAVARALAEKGREVVVLEAREDIGRETSSRNSEVIHAGLYYRPDSLKARLCVAGKQALYDYCEAHGIAYRRCGKLVVATSEEEIPALHSLAERAQAVGGVETTLLDAAATRQREPALAAHAALWSPSTGILDTHAFLLALKGDIEERGGWIALGSPVEGGEIRDDGIALTVGGATPMNILARRVVLCAGLAAPDVARSLKGLPPEKVPRHRFAKGSYFHLQGRAPFRHLIYPAPPPRHMAGLGIHLTFDLTGRARFGPNVKWLPAETRVSDLDYRVDPTAVERYATAVRRYWPDLPDDALVPDFSGVRPKLQAPGERSQDFAIHGPTEHGIPGLVTLYGIESPGLTAALAIGAHVAAKLE